MDQARRIELLVTDQLAPVTEAIADLVAHGTAQDWDALVRGFHADSGWLHTSSKRGPLRCAEDRLRWRRPTMLALVAAAPDGTEAAAIRDKVEHVSLSGSRESNEYSTPSPGNLVPLDVGHLAHLPALRRLTVQHAEELRGLEAVLAPLTTLSLENVPLTALDLAGATRLVEVRLNKLGSLVSLTGLPASLQKLELYGLTKLARIDGDTRNLTSLTVHSTPVLPRADGLASLTDLSCYQYDRDWLAALPALTHVQLWGARSTAPFAGKTRLETLGILHSDEPLEMTPLDLPALHKLRVVYTKQLRSLAGLRGGSLPAVTDLEIDADELTSLDGLEIAPKVTKASIRGDKLQDVSALAAMTQLEWLDLRCPSLTDVSPLAGLRKLERLSIERCRQLRDLLPLAEVPLTELICSNSDVTKTSIPPALHPVVYPPSLVAKSKARAARGAKPVAAKGEARTTLAKLKRLLLTRDWEKLNQGLELLRSLEDPALYEGLLSGSTLGRVRLEDGIRRWYSDAAGKLIPGEYDLVTPNALLAYGKPLRPYREALIRALVGQAPETCETAVALRQGWKQILCNAGGSGPIDLAPIAALPNLTAAVLASASGLHHPEALAGAAKLTSLALLWIKEPDLGALASPSLETFCLVRSDGLETLFPFSAFPQVQTILFHGVEVAGEIEGTFPRLTSADLAIQKVAPMITALARSPLERLRLRAPGDARLLAPLAETQTLTELDLEYGTDFTDLAPLTKLGSLRRLALRRCAPKGIGGLAGLEHLEELEIWRTTLTEDDARGLAELPNLKRLRFDDEVKLAAPLPPALAALVQTVA